MEILAQLGVAVAELFEAEGRSLRRNLVRLTIAAAVGVVLLLLALGGAGFLMWGYFLFLENYMSPAAAAITVGLSALMVASIGAGLIRQLL